jgi:hypothetical protein
MQLMDSTMGSPSAVAQKLHLKPSARQAPKAIPYITHNAAERHLLKVTSAETSNVLQWLCGKMSLPNKGKESSCYPLKFLSGKNRRHAA